MLAAFVLAVAALFPTVGAAPCADDFAVTATAAATATASPAAVAGDTQAQAGETGQDPCADGACLCVQCNCHQAGACMPAVMAMQRTPLVRHEGHRPAQFLAPASDLIFGFERPPRA